MPEAIGVLPESAKIDPSGPCFGTPFCSFRVNLGTSVIKKCVKNDHIRGPEGHPALRVYSSNKKRPSGDVDQIKLVYILFGG